MGKTFLRYLNISVLSWISWSSNINPTEHACNYLDRWLNQHISTTLIWLRKLFSWRMRTNSTRLLKHFFWEHALGRQSCDWKQRNLNAPITFLTFTKTLKPTPLRTTSQTAIYSMSHAFPNYKWQGSYEWTLSSCRIVDVIPGLKQFGKQSFCLLWLCEYSDSKDYKYKSIYGISCNHCQRAHYGFERYVSFVMFSPFLVMCNPFHFSAPAWYKSKFVNEVCVNLYKKSYFQTHKPL